MLCDKINDLGFASNGDTDQPELPPSLIRVFTVCMKEAMAISYQSSKQQTELMPRLISLCGMQNLNCWVCQIMPK